MTKFTKNATLLALLLAVVTFTTHTMEVPEDNQFSLAGLPADIQKIITNFLSIKQEDPALSSRIEKAREDASKKMTYEEMQNLETFDRLNNAILAAKKDLREAELVPLKNTIYSIKSLAMVDKRFNQIINEPQFCLILIKHLAQKFNKTDETIAVELGTQGANNILTVQDQLETLVKNLSKSESNGTEFDVINTFKKDNPFVDLNFTYDNYMQKNRNKNRDDNNKSPSAPLLTMVCYDKNINLIEALLNAGANVNCFDEAGNTPLMMSISSIFNPSIQKYALAKITLICKQPKLKIDQQNKLGQTALFQIASAAKPNYLNEIQPTIQMLLNLGADPEFTNGTQKTPLQELKRIVGTDKKLNVLITMFEEAIEKKYEKK